MPANLSRRRRRPRKSSRRRKKSSRRRRKSSRRRRKKFFNKFNMHTGPPREFPSKRGMKEWKANPWLCKKCGKKFLTASDLYRHQGYTKNHPWACGASFVKTSVVKPLNKNEVRASF